MNLYFRLVLTILKALLSKQVRCDEKFVWKGRVLPNDIDAYGHMNNGRYITLLGLAAMSCRHQNRIGQVFPETGLSVHLGPNPGAMGSAAQIIREIYHRSPDAAL